MLHLLRDPAKVRGRAGQAAWPFALLGSQSRATMFGDGVGCRVCVWGPPHPGVSWPRCPLTSHAHVLFSSSLQCHHLHRGAQHVPALWQESVLW